MGSKIEKIHPHAAGIDIGSVYVFVSVESEEVRQFRTFSSGLCNCRDYLIEKGVKTVAMEATGVYWLGLYDLLCAAGIEVIVVNPSSVKMVPGRKSDIQDCQWLAQLHSYGLLSGSVVLAENLRELRTLIRLREDYIEQKSSYINRMQKVLVMMNIRLHTVISQIHGKSGMRIVHAILEGERDPGKLALLCDKRILNSKYEEVIESLNGQYNKANLFCLGQAVKGFEFCETQMEACDQQIEAWFNHNTAELTPIHPTKKPKSVRWNAPKVEGLHQKLITLCGGCDASVLPGLTDYSSLKIMAEVGTDLSRWPTEKHFTSWLGLSPGKNQSGKTSRRSKKRTQTTAGRIFKVSAQSLLLSKTNALGEFGRRIKARKGPAIAIAATARKLAEMYWRIHVKGMEYVEQGEEQYLHAQALKKKNYILKQAKKLGLQLVDAQ